MLKQLGLTPVQFAVMVLVAYNSVLISNGPTKIRPVENKDEVKKEEGRMKV